MIAFDDRIPNDYWYIFFLVGIPGFLKHNENISMFYSITKQWKCYGFGYVVLQVLYFLQKRTYCMKEDDSFWALGQQMAIFVDNIYFIIF